MGVSAAVHLFGAHSHGTSSGRVATDMFVALDGFSVPPLYCFAGITASAGRRAEWISFYKG